MAQNERNRDRQMGEQSKTDRSRDQQKQSDDRNQQNPRSGQRENISGDRSNAGRDSDMRRESDRPGRSSIDESNMDEEDRGVL